MIIVKKQYQAWHSHSQYKLRNGDCEHSILNKYVIAYYFLGLKFWIKTINICTVPVYAKASLAFCGFSDFKDDFHKKCPRFSKKFYNKETVNLIAL
jgi:hypothetical protein